MKRRTTFFAILLCMPLWAHAEFAAVTPNRADGPFRVEPSTVLGIDREVSISHCDPGDTAHQITLLQAQIAEEEANLAQLERKFREAEAKLVEQHQALFQRIKDALLALPPSAFDGIYIPTFPDGRGGQDLTDTNIRAFIDGLIGRLAAGGAHSIRGELGILGISASELTGYLNAHGNWSHIGVLITSSKAKLADLYRQLAQLLSLVPNC